MFHLCHWRTAGIVLFLLAAGGFAAAVDTTAADSRPAAAMEPFVAATLELDLGEVEEAEMRHGAFELRVVGGTAVEIIGGRSTCPCLQLSAKISGTSAVPGEIYRVPFMLDTSQVHAGPFTRTILLSATGYPTTVLTLKGVVRQRVVVTPQRIVTLGIVPGIGEEWERKLQIQRAPAETEALILGYSSGTALFRAELKEVAPSVYELTLRPKTPFPQGRIDETLEIEIKEPGNRPNIRIGIRGEVGAGLRAVPAQLMVDPGKTPCSGTFRVSRGSIRVWGMGMGARNPRQSPEQNDEAKEKPDFSKITLAGPEGISYKVDAKEDHASVEVTFSPEVFTARSKGTLLLSMPGYIPIPVHYKVSGRPHSGEAPSPRGGEGE